MSEPQVPFPRAAFIAIRITATLQAALGLAQTTFAGDFLNGQYGMLAVHRATAMVIGAVALVQAVVAVLVLAAGGRPGWQVWVSLALAAAVGGQIALGFGRLLGVHVTLGVLIVAGMALMAGWVWRTPVPPRAAPTGRPAAGEPLGAAR